MQLSRIELSSTGLAVEPAIKWSNLAENKPFSEIMEDKSAIWYRVNWRLLEEEFLGWFIWLKDNSKMVEGFVEEMKGSSSNQG